MDFSWLHTNRYICITHTQRILITRHLVIYLWWWLYVCHPISKGQSVTTVLIQEQETYSVYMKRPIRYLSYSPSHRKKARRTYFFWISIWYHERLSKGLLEDTYFNTFINQFNLKWKGVQIKVLSWKTSNMSYYKSQL